MSKPTGYVLALFTALTHAVGVGTASAKRIETSSQTFRAVWTPLELIIGAFDKRCNVTLEGSFHSKTIAKVESQLIGYVTGATCGNGEVTFLQASLPWRIQYERFTGTLPTIASIRIKFIEAAFRISSTGIVCLYTTEAGEPFVGILNFGAGGTVTGFRTDETVPISNGSPGCLEAIFKGTGAVTVQNSTTSIRVRLVQ